MSHIQQADDVSCTSSVFQGFKRSLNPQKDLTLKVGADELATEG